MLQINEKQSHHENKLFKYIETFTPEIENFR